MPPPNIDEFSLHINWTTTLGDIRQRAIEKDTANPNEYRCRLVASLLVHSRLSYKEFLVYLFSSSISELSSRATKFLANSPGHKVPFGPGFLYEKWHQHENCREHLHDLIVKPCAEEIVIAESDRAIRDRSLKVSVSSITMEIITNVLEPTKLLKTYLEHAPFTIGLLRVFTESPNTYQKKKARRVAEDEDGTDSDAEDEETPRDDDVDSDLDMAEVLVTESPPSRYDMVIVAVISMLLYVRNRANNILPLMMGLFFRIEGASSKTLATLNEIGLSTSARTIDRARVRLSEQAVAAGRRLFASDGLFSVIFDNINIYLHKFDQRLSNRNSMIHATNISLLGLHSEATAEGESLKEKLNMRGRRVNDKTGECITITKEDSEQMEAAHVAHITHLLFLHWPGHETWEGRKEMKASIREMFPQVRPLAPEKTQTYPMGVVDVNEGSLKGVIDVMTEIQTMSGLTEEEFSSKVRIVKGDLLTSRNIRGARRIRMDDTTTFNQLTYIQELSELFHWALNAVHMLVRVHLGNSIQDPGSLSHHKDLLGRVWDVNKPDYAAAKSLLTHSLVARLLHCVMKLKALESWSALSKYKPTLEELKKLARDIQKTFATSTAGRTAQSKKDDILAHSIYFIRDVLIFLEFEHAIDYADAGRVLRVLKFWAYSFRGAGLTNYAREALEVLLIWENELPEALQKNLERSWFVNRTGRLGGAIPADLYLEQLNYIVKCVTIAQGAGVTIDHIIKKGSACSEMMRSIALMILKYFGNPHKNRKHKEAKFQKDLHALIDDLTKGKVHTLIENRTLLAPPPKKQPATGVSIRQSSIIDVIAIGAKILNAGGYSQFVQTTTYDNALGYPLDGDDSSESRGGSESVFDGADNPLSIESEGYGDNSSMSSIGGGDGFEG